jgi:hypothetical protein
MNGNTLMGIILAFKRFYQKVLGMNSIFKKVPIFNKENFTVSGILELMLTKQDILPLSPGVALNPSFTHRVSSLRKNSTGKQNTKSKRTAL